MLTVHRTYEGLPGHKVCIFYVADGRKVKKLSSGAASRWFKSLAAGTKLLVTAAHSADAFVLALAERGVCIYQVAWRATGLARNLEPKQIAAGFAALPEGILRVFKPRPDLVPLRRHVDSRRAILKHRIGDYLRLDALRISAGLQDGEALPPAFQAYADEIKSDQRLVETKVDHALAELAKSIPECVLFNDIADIKEGWVSAAMVVAYLGDISRFPSVSSLWHYCGQHVVDGGAPQRRVGESGDWNPKLRECLWQLSTSLIKNRQNRWRAVYEQFRDAELAIHNEKHPNCPAKDGHCGARARRRVVKEILKEFWAAATGSEATCKTIRALPEVAAV